MINSRAIFIFVMCTSIHLSRSQETLLESNTNDEQLDQNDVTTQLQSTANMTGRVLDILLKPLRKVWRVYIVRTLIPSLMGAKLIVLVPTLAVAVILLEGAIAIAAFFYLLFITAVASKSDKIEVETQFPWTLVDTILDKHDEEEAKKEMSTPGTPTASDIVMLPTAYDTTSDIYTTSHDWNREDNNYNNYNTINMSNDIIQEINAMNQDTSHSNPFASYYSPYQEFTSSHSSSDFTSNGYMNTYNNNIM